MAGLIAEACWGVGECLPAINCSNSDEPSEIRRYVDQMVRAASQRSCRGDATRLLGWDRGGFVHSLTSSSAATSSLPL